jgi:hypothetical protein
MCYVIFVKISKRGLIGILLIVFSWVLGFSQTYVKLFFLTCLHKREEGDSN